MKTTHLMISVDVVCGEYSFRNIHLENLFTSDYDPTQQYVINFIERYYPGPFVRQDDEYFFDEGNIRIKKFTWKKISKKDLPILLKYL